MKHFTLQASVGSVGAAVAALWLGLHFAVKLLIGLIVCDILSGLVVAFQQKRISSDVSRRGMARKAMMLIVVGTADLVGRLIGTDLPLAAAVAGFYCIHEAVSITENAAHVGLPVPQPLVDAIEKLKGPKSST